eukprot:5489552-Ditylum_brightwellii.AAC.1
MPHNHLDDKPKHQEGVALICPSSKSIKKTTHNHWKFYAAGCGSGSKIDGGFLRCNELMHLHPTCWNNYYENLHFGFKYSNRVMKARKDAEDKQDLTLGIDLVATNVTSE